MDLRLQPVPIRRGPLVTVQDRPAFIDLLAFLDATSLALSMPYNPNGGEKEVATWMASCRLN